ncbi:MAG: serine/threonine-protein kinase [Myxococcota bacterium]|jgi:serine/threonine-protein kinase
MASVYQATDTRLHVERAVQFLSSDLAHSSKLMERFEREARVMAQLEHPNVVPVHDVGRDGSIVFLVMSLLQAGSLHDQLLRNGAFPSSDVVQATPVVVQALHASDARGIIHRDVKPQNVLIDAHGTPPLRHCPCLDQPKADRHGCAAGHMVRHAARTTRGAQTVREAQPAHKAAA